MTGSTDRFAALLLIVACSGPPADPPAGPGVVPELGERELRAQWQVRTDSRLASDLRATCQASLSDRKPVLLELSAPWCQDCRRLHQLARLDPLRSELEGWHRLTVDVGRFDRHPDLIEGFEVSAIARWIALRPTTCDVPVTQWPRLAIDTFEPETGSGPRTPEAVAAWLVSARGAG